LPVLGVCRGLQAMNVFAGGTLLQHVDGHAGASWGHGPALTHPLRVVPGTRLARILRPVNTGGGVLTVNSYHHQAVRRQDLAPGFVPAAFSASRAGDLVEGFETASGPFRMAVQCHPERTESTPDAFERLFRFFVDACRGPLTAR
jgi:putative glutamine amidotransferase